MLFRVIAAGTAGLILWSAAASRLIEHVRLPLAAVVKGAVVSQPFGCTAVQLEPFDPFCPTLHVHTGVDLAAPAGTPVYAATGGLARIGYDALGAGLFVAISFDERVRILYCHLRQADVMPGSSVQAGALIGEVGSTGLSTGPHLHLEIQVDGHPVDPAVWLASPGPS